MNTYQNYWKDARIVAKRLNQQRAQVQRVLTDVERMREQTQKLFDELPVVKKAMETAAEAKRQYNQIERKVEQARLRYIESLKHLQGIPRS